MKKQTNIKTPHTIKARAGFVITHIFDYSWIGTLSALSVSFFFNKTFLWNSVTPAQKDKSLN